MSCLHRVEMLCFPVLPWGFIKDLFLLSASFVLLPPAIHDNRSNVLYNELYLHFKMHSAILCIALKSYIQYFIELLTTCLSTWKWTASYFLLFRFSQTLTDWKQCAFECDLQSLGQVKHFYGVDIQALVDHLRTLSGRYSSIIVHVKFRFSSTDLFVLGSEQFSLGHK